MGYSYGTRCISCDSEKEYYLGIGRMYSSSFDFLIDTVRSSKLKEHLLLLEKEHNGEILEIPSFRLYECPKCKTIHKRIDFIIKYDNKEIFQVQYKCNTCNSYLLPSKLDDNSFGEQNELAGYKCSKCGKETLERGLSITMWD